MPDLIKVKRDGPRGWHWISRAKYDASPRDFEPVDEAQVSSGLGTDSGDQFSEAELRAVITEVTGKSPHHKTGYDKLVTIFNDLNAKA